MVAVSDGQTSSGQAPAPVWTPVDRPLLSLALTSMMDAVGAHSGAVYLRPGDGPVLEMAVMAGLPRSFAAPWERVGVSAPIPVAEAVRERRLVWVGGAEEMARRYPRIAVVLPYPFALAALPVLGPSRVHGAVYVTWPGSHPPELSDRERRELTTACERLALRLERAASENRSVRAESDLLDLSVSGVSDTLGPLEAARMVARLPYGMCSLDVSGRITFANEAAAELLGVPVGELLGSQLWAAVAWLNDPLYEERYRAALLSQEATSFVALRPPSHWLSLRLYPSTTGISVRISRARAVSQTRPSDARSEDAPTRLVSMSQALSLAGALTETVSVQDVVGLVADEIAPAVGSQALALLGARAGRLHVLGHHGYPEPRLVERFDRTPLSSPTPGAHAVTHGVPAFFESRQHLERLYPARRSSPDGFAAWAFLPLIASGRPVGACVLAYAEPHVFSTHERAVLTSLAGLIAQALDRALLYDVKHRLAHGLQAALLPPSLPSLAGIEATARYLPATRGMEIGGDFYDLVPSPPLAAAVIGDVQGHNVTAAGLMGQIRTAVRAYTTVGQEPGEVMRSTNRLLIDLGSELFASCLYLRLDPAAGRAVMARAGHPPPLLRRADGRVRVLDLAGGPLLGIDGAAAYPTTEVELTTGCVLALYTDGLIETPGVDIEDAVAELGRRLGEAGNRPLEEVADDLVGRHATAEERLDDVALLLLRAVADG
ncbi:SpoIIE family protein phosphatase [Streptomyces sp. MBT97]|uniref:SpoIIE family protein phosphatase n=1 Tax=Streptomyces sp. MBT97 TaxID=2800411 RepID=UPI00190E5756|nr:SpoIIE family protein phosphatase [Streptomyces sp. MBT97]MBK3636189.1 SpoIIE family protein phosphatase [Streptomyces sp. MBT97]